MAHGHTTEIGAALTDGTMDVEKSAQGYRWVYVAPGGAMHMGGQLFKTKKAALEAGNKWKQDNYDS